MIIGLLIVQKSDLSYNGKYPGLSGRIPYLLHDDVALYMKRVRKYISKLGINESIHTYIVGEYGPNSFRPHFHLLLFFDSDKLAQNIVRIANSYWRFGRVDCSASRATLKTTLARILIALVLSPYIFRKFVLFGLSQDFQISSDMLFSNLRLRKLNRVTSMKSLMERVCHIMALIPLYSHGARLSIPAFTDPLYVDIAIFMNLQRYYDMLETLNKDPHSRRQPCSSLPE